MARVTGPLHSDSASGRFAGSLVFASWKGRPYVRQLVTPENPKSARQTGVRVMMKWLAQLWTSLSAPNKATWETLAESADISTFNAYVGHNLGRWQSNDGPTNEYPAAEAGTSLDPDSTLTEGVALVTVGHEGYATGSATPDSVDCLDAIGVMVFRGESAPSPLDWGSCIQILPVTPGVEWTFTDSPLEAGTYHYKIAYFSADGLIGDLSAADNDAVVT